MTLLKLRPEILQHSNIPKPLHGMAPREILGKAWWDKTRKAVYAKQDFKCIACGVHKMDAKYHNHIEAHEYYDMDYAKGCMEIKEIVGLCHSCHAYIHSGRTNMMMQSGKIGQQRALGIMRHGFKVLKKAGLEPWHGHCQTYLNMLDFLGLPIDKSLISTTKRLTREQDVGKIQQNWSKWHLIIDGERHYGKFKSMQEWENHYAR